MGQQPPSWDPYGQQDPRRQQPQPPPYPPNGLLQLQGPSGQPDPGQWQWQPFWPDRAYQGQRAYSPQQPYGQEQPYPGQAPYQGVPYGQPLYQQGQPDPGQPYPQHPPLQPPWQAPGPRPRPARAPWSRRHPALTALGGIVALFVLTGIISAAAGGGKAAAPAAGGPPAANQSAATSAAPAATQSAAAAEPKAHTVATFTGSGIEKTPQFTVPDTWKLVYSFSCADFGQSGNFQVFEDGGADFGGVTVNDLALSKSSSTWAHSDGGTHYLEINSECTWKVKVVDQP